MTRGIPSSITERMKQADRLKETCLALEAGHGTDSPFGDRRCRCGERKRRFDICCAKCWALVPVNLRRHLFVFGNTAPGSEMHVTAVRRCLDAIDAQRVCRKCGCTNEDCSGCIARTGAACSWVAWDLCSACAIAEEISKLDAG